MMLETIFIIAYQKNWPNFTYNPSSIMNILER
jgi:hypothetical protein